MPKPVTSLGLKEASQAIGDDGDRWERWERLKSAVCPNATVIWVGIIPISTYPSFAEKRAVKLELSRKRMWIVLLNFPMSRTASPNGNPWLNKTPSLRLKHC